MPLNPIPEQSYSYFLAEAQDLLQQIEQGLLNLRDDRSTAKIHRLMRAAHTLKGSASSVGQSAISSVAHLLEDVFTALYNPDLVIDSEVESLLFQGYECLRILLTAEVTGSHIDESEVLNRSAGIIAQLQTKLGDQFNQDAMIPSSLELGFDIVQSMFEMGVSQRLQELRQSLHQPDSMLLETLRTQAEILLGLAESVELHGFQAIAQATLTALAHHPDQVRTIAQLALEDFSQGQAAVLAGDRTQGGAPSPQLQQLAGEKIAVSQSAAPAGAAPPPLPTEQPHRVEPAPPPPPLQPSEPSSKSPLLAHWLQTLTHPFHRQRPIAAHAHPEDSTISPPPMPSPDAEASLNPEIQAASDPLPDHWQTPAEPGPTQAAPGKPAHAIPGPTELSLDELFQDIAPQAIPFNPEQSTDLGTTPPDPLAPVVSEVEPVPPPQPDPNDLLPSPVAHNPSPVSTPTSAGGSLNREAVLPSIRVELAQLERLTHLTGELLTHQSQHTQQTDHLRLIVQELVDRLEKHQQTLGELRDWSDQRQLETRTAQRGLVGQGWSRQTSHPFQPSPLVAQFDTLEMDRYNSLQLLLQTSLNEAIELSSIAELVEQATRQAQRTLEVKHQTLRQVQDDMTKARMQPLGELLNRFPRVLKQLSSTYQKPVELSLKGTDVLVDKAIVEKLYDPILHLVRNAFDHGIEASETRQQAGKPAIGQIEIRAFHQGNRTVIEIADDGQGINWKRVGQQAVKLGMVSAEQLETLPRMQLLSLLFEPGFSTTTRPNELSGRGIGLNVVRSQLASLKGVVSVNSDIGQGTVFSLQIPLSLSITKLLVCQSNDVFYAFPVSAIAQILMPQSDQLRTLSEQRVALHLYQHGREVVVPIRRFLDLMAYSNTRLQTSASNDSPGHHSAPFVVIFQTTNGLIGVQVEQVIGEQELMIRSLGASLTPPPYIYGCCILNNSQMALVVDVELLIQQSVFPEDTNPLSEALSTNNIGNLSLPAAGQSGFHPPAPNHPRQPNILIVDDSLTQRQILLLTLQKVGYQVCQAEDGLAALLYVQQNPDIDLILCDVEMPRLNGFEFLSQCRPLLEAHQIPVIMLTSRSSTKYRQVAQELGVKAYLTKPYTDYELLSALTSCLSSSSAKTPV